MKLLLAIVVVLLIGAGSVMAEPCSTPWVLWEHFKAFAEDGITYTNQPQWKPTKGFSDKKECDGYITDLFNRYNSDRGYITVPDKNYVQADRWSNEYKCLPNGTNPN